jgi:2-polyprenyl-3-methyl-5-hydroxy-6-metoxy-1,4-benzoquinol methylase
MTPARININTPEYWNEIYRREWETHDVVSGHYHRDYGLIHDAIVKLIPAGSRVLDIACGPGILCRKVKLQVPGAAVTGIDFSTYTIARNVESDRELDIAYHCMDIRTSLGALGQEFDAISMCEIIEHLDDPVPVVRDAMNLLKENGLFIVSCPHADEIPDPEHVREWDHESLFHLLAPYSRAISFIHFPPPYFHYWMLAHLRKCAL